MKITPAEIRQKEFERNFRGYDKDEVNAFLQTMSQEWERILEENREMRYRLDASQKEVEKLREVESSLYKTLKTAEDTGANLVEQANKSAELKVREAELKGEEIISESKAKGQQILDQAKTKARSIIDEMEVRIQELKQNYHQADGQYDDLLFQLENAAQKALQAAERARERRSVMQKSSPEASAIREEYNRFVSQQTSEFEQKLVDTPTPTPNTSETPNAAPPSEPSAPKPAPDPQSETEPVTPPPAEKKATRKSFFDEID
ncbi:MAG: DivIVA domain-containing protein [Bacteroidota bacterium]